jgi:hypothetical protein
MIWNDDFIWLHVPKCGGSFIETVFSRRFSRLSSLRQDPVGIDVDPEIRWHDSIARRERRDPAFLAGDREVIIPIRRLPSWLVSIYNFECGRSPWLDHSPERLFQGKFMHQTGVEMSADAIIRSYVPSDLVESGRLYFTRLEYLEMDFRIVFGRFIDTTCVPTSDFAHKVNASADHLPARIRDQLFESSGELYRLCPAWAAIERMAYGAIED